MSAISEYNEACAKGRRALEAGQYADALRQFEIAWGAQLAIPDSKLDDEELAFPRESIREMLEYCKTRATETGQVNRTNHAIQFSDVTYQRG